MSSNVIDALIPKLMAGAIKTLRSTSVMPRLVNTNYDRTARGLGDTIDIPVPATLQVTDVVPSNVAPANIGTEFKKVQIKLDQWKQSSFHLTDKEMKEVVEGTVPMQVSSAVTALAESIDKAILQQFKSVYNYVGEAGKTPFSATTSGSTTTPGSVKVAIDANRVLNEKFCPRQERYCVINPAAEAAAVGLREFSDASAAGTTATIKDAAINRKFGMDWFMDQNVAQHTTNVSKTGYRPSASITAGATEFSITGASSMPIAGDVFSFAGDTQTYVVSEVSGSTIKINPGVATAKASNTAITFRGSHVANLAFHRNAIALVTRPLTLTGNGMSSSMAKVTDPKTGISIRLEISRQTKQMVFSYDILYGLAVIRPELITRIAG